MKNLPLLLLPLLIATLPSKAQQIATGDLWCVAKNNAEDSALQSAIDWACGTGGADCNPIQQGGACFEPEDIQSHASYAFNDYFVKSGGNGSACDFSGTAALTSLNPGHGSCLFPSIASKNGNQSEVTDGSTNGVGYSPYLNSKSSPLILRKLLGFISVIAYFL